MTGIHMTALRLAVAAATLTACFACSSVVPGTALPVDDSAPAAAAGGSSAADTTEDVDACALATAEDLAPLVGTAEGKRTDASYTEICDWKGRGNVVELVVGAVGSAPDNAVPDDPILHPKPIGDGLSATSSGLVEFAAGERVFIVSVDVSGKGDRDKATQLARAVRGRV
jgi:hypothetical protein